MKKIIKHYPMTDRLIVRRGYICSVWSSCNNVAPVTNFCRQSYMYYLSIFDLLILITPLVSSNLWPLYYLSIFDLQLMITPLVSSNLWPLYYLSIFDLQLMITSGAFGIFKHFLCGYFIGTKDKEKPKPLTYLVISHQMSNIQRFGTTLIMSS